MNTEHEKIIKRADGSRVRTKVNLWTSYGKAHYGEMVHVCEKGKRTWTSPHNPDDYSYRRLSMEEREKRVLAIHRTVATEDEILSVKIELWEQLKPTTANSAE